MTTQKKSQPVPVDEAHPDVPAYLLPEARKRAAQGEDFIDFPVSALWASHYARDVGITPDFPDEFYAPLQSDTTVLQGVIKRMVSQMKRMTAEIKDLDEERDLFIRDHPGLQPFAKKPVKTLKAVASYRADDFIDIDDNDETREQQTAGVEQKADFEEVEGEEEGERRPQEEDR